MLFFFIDDTLSPPEVVAGNRRLREAGIRCRYLCLEDPPRLDFPARDYRTVPARFFHNAVQLVFGNCVAQHFGGESSKVLILRHEAHAESQRRLFEMIWLNGKVPKVAMSSPYKLVTIRSPGWSAYKAATLLISVGQSYHEGEKFAVTVAWAARHFETLHVLVADSLQRHNAPGDWRAQGAAWIERNHAAWASCEREVTVSHWDDWLAKPEFPRVLEQFRAAAAGALGALIKRDAHAFIARQAGKGLGSPVEQSREYLLEELAAITLQARACPGARVYPGPQLESFRAVAAGLVAEAPRGLERQYHTTIDFKHRRTGALREVA